MLLIHTVEKMYHNCLSNGDSAIAFVSVSVPPIRMSSAISSIYLLNPLVIDTVVSIVAYVMKNATRFYNCVDIFYIDFQTSAKSTKASL